MGDWFFGALIRFLISVDVDREARRTYISQESSAGDVEFEQRISDLSGELSLRYAVGGLRGTVRRMLNTRIVLSILRKTLWLVFFGVDKTLTCKCTGMYLHKRYSARSGVLYPAMPRDPC